MISCREAFGNSTVGGHGATKSEQRSPDLLSRSLRTSLAVILCRAVRFALSSTGRLIVNAPADQQA